MTEYDADDSVCFSNHLFHQGLPPLSILLHEAPILWFLLQFLVIISGLFGMATDAECLEILWIIILSASNMMRVQVIRVIRQWESACLTPPPFLCSIPSREFLPPGCLIIKWIWNHIRDQSQSIPSITSILYMENPIQLFKVFTQPAKLGFPINCLG